jgi:hypothetical protein
MQWISAKHAPWMLTTANYPTCNSKQSVPVLHPAEAKILEMLHKLGRGLTGRPQ